MTWTGTTLPLSSPYPQRSQPIRQGWRPYLRARMRTIVRRTVVLNSGALYWARVENLLFNCLLVKVIRTAKKKKTVRQTMLYLTEQNVSPASRTTGVSQVISCFKLRGNAIVFTSIKLQFTDWHCIATMLNTRTGRQYKWKALWRIWGRAWFGSPPGRCLTRLWCLTCKCRATPLPLKSF